MEEGSSRRGMSVAPIVTEVSSEDKVAAYVEEADDPIPPTVQAQSDNTTNNLLNTYFVTKNTERSQYLPGEYSTNPVIPTETILNKPALPLITVKEAITPEASKQNRIAMGSYLNEINQTLRDQSQFLEQTVPGYSFSLPAVTQIVHPGPAPFIPYPIPASVPSTRTTSKVSKDLLVTNKPIRPVDNPLFNTYPYTHSGNAPVASTRIMTKTVPHTAPLLLNKSAKPSNAVNFEILPPVSDELFSFDDRHMPHNVSPRRPNPVATQVNQYGFTSTVNTSPVIKKHPAPSAIYTTHPQSSSNREPNREPRALVSEQDLLPTSQPGYGGDRLTFSTPDNIPESTRSNHSATRSKTGTEPENISNHDETRHMLEVMCGQMALGRVPMGPPEIFDGRDPLSFPLWKVAFDALVNNAAMSATNKLNLLNRCLGGSAKAAVTGYLMLPPHEAYDAAYRQLIKRYGNKVSLGNSFRDQLRAWPRISGTDNVGLRNYVDYLQQCRTAMSSFKNLNILDNESENADMIDKLPVWLSRKWARKVAAHREEHEEFPSFSDFMDFLDREDRFAHDPIAKGLSKGNSSKNQIRSSSFASEGHRSAGVGSNFGACSFCRERHSIHMCNDFKTRSLEVRLKFVRDNRLCFACLNVGHQARECRSRKICEICQRRHPTVMHTDERNPTNVPQQSSATTCASNDHSAYATRKSSMVVPVHISHTDNPDRQKIVFAMLDTQSDTSFVTEKTARDLGLVGREVRLSLSTMTSSNRVIRCKHFDGLQCAGTQWSG